MQKKMRVGGAASKRGIKGIKLQLLIVSKRTNILFPTVENNFRTSSDSGVGVLSLPRNLSNSAWPMSAVQITAKMKSSMKTKTMTQNMPTRACVMPCTSSCSAGTIRVRRKNRASQSNLATVPKASAVPTASEGQRKMATLIPHWSNMQPQTARMSRMEKRRSSPSRNVTPLCRRYTTTHCSNRAKLRMRCFTTICHAGVLSPASMPKRSEFPKMPAPTAAWNHFASAQRQMLRSRPWPPRRSVQ
mmetsp:Transcript_14550/g.36966  ORF Transcript_14550/g.36966 Transcript_14550/m.36966 type:complete len:245 (+) Transcript_14550:769-1503(+)